MESRPVDLWTISLREKRPIVLSEDETARARRFRFDDDRERWTRARSALRTILSGYAGEPPEALRFTYGPHGKPALAGDIEFNLSHAGDWALVAVARSVPVGVDIERIRPNVDMAALLRRLGEPVDPGSDLHQTGLYQAWARREARSKVTGGALFDAPRAGVIAVDLKAPEGYAAAVALLEYKPEVTHCQRLNLT